jgi:hypothetical protein
MKRTAIEALGALMLTILLWWPAGAGTAIEDCERTVTLPNGEVVLDVNGEWEVLSEFQGAYGGLKPVNQIYLLRQEGTAFTAVKVSDTGHLPKGEELLRGELCAEGFKNTELKRLLMDGTVEWIECTWEIQERGNKLVFDDGRTIIETLTRKQP